MNTNTKGFERRLRGLLKVNPGVLRRNWENHEKSVGKTGNPGEDLPNTSLECSCYTTCLVNQKKREKKILHIF
jgi:hypothetical protein